MIQPRTLGTTAALLALVVLQAPARAGSLSGTASLRTPITLPPDAVFEAVLIDHALADAPARELGRIRLQPAGPSPFRFTIPYRNTDLRPAGRYSVRATVRQGDRLLFTTDTITPVLTGGPSQPLNLQLVPVGTGRSSGRGEPPSDQRRQLLGLFRYLADAPSIQLCAGGGRLPVAMEGDYLRLERAYTRAQPPGTAGQPMLVNLEGRITLRPSAEPGREPERTLVVERFVSVHPGQTCPLAGSSAQPPLRGTLWRLQALQSGDGPSLIEPPARPVELQLAPDSPRVSGSGGCNRLMGGFQLNGAMLRFSSLASTQMACQAPVMAFERRYGEALGRVRRWSLDKASLLLQDGRGRTLLLFTASP